MVINLTTLFKNNQVIKEVKFINNARQLIDRKHRHVIRKPYSRVWVSRDESNAFDIALLMLYYANTSFKLEIC